MMSQKNQAQDSGKMNIIQMRKILPKNVQIQIKKAQPRRFARLARHCSIQSWWPSRNKLPNLANMREALSKNLSTTKSMIREIEIGRLRDQLVVVPFLDWGSWGHCIM